MSKIVSPAKIAEDVQNLIATYFSFLDFNNTPANRSHALMSSDYSIDAIVSASTLMLIDSQHLMKFNREFRNKIFQSQIDYVFDMHAHSTVAQN